MRVCRVIAEDGTLGWVEERGDKLFALDGSPYKEFVSTDRSVTPGLFLPPVEPPNIVALAVNYRGHSDETNIKPREEPQYFFKASTSLIVDGQKILLPPQAAGEVDFEAELALIIKKEAREVDTFEAHEYVLGYLCANDVTARDCQFHRDMQWARSKSFDTFCPVSRFFSTDVDPLDLRVRCLLNGETVQDDRTSHLIFNPYQIISFLSYQMKLMPGTLILTGTPQGVGFTRTPPLFLKKGDVVSVEIEGIGKLTNEVDQRPAPGKAVRPKPAKSS